MYQLIAQNAGARLSWPKRDNPYLDMFSSADMHIHRRVRRIVPDLQRIVRVAHRIAGVRQYLVVDDGILAAHEVDEADHEVA